MKTPCAPAPRSAAQRRALLRLEHLADRAVPLRRMGGRPGPGQAALLQPGVQLGQALEQAQVAQALALGLGALRGEPLVEAGDVAVELGPRLALALVGEGGLVGAQRLAHDLAREAQLPRDLADALVLVAEEPPDLGDGLHDQHPRLAPWL